MRLIVGLGNPGVQYAKTRHNIGFRVINVLNESFSGVPIRTDTSSHVYQARIHNQDVLLIKPQTCMNRSGVAVLSVLQRDGESPEDLVVIHDDLDLQLGKLRIRRKGGDAGHKGLRSIIDCLQTDEFIRIRLGIGRPDSDTLSQKDVVREQIVDYVLQPFEQDEESIVNAMIARAVAAIELIVDDQLTKAMNIYNSISGDGGER